MTSRPASVIHVSHKTVTLTSGIKSHGCCGRDAYSKQAVFSACHRLWALCMGSRCTKAHVQVRLPVEMLCVLPIMAGF